MNVRSKLEFFFVFLFYDPFIFPRLAGRGRVASGKGRSHRQLYEVLYVGLWARAQTPLGHAVLTTAGVTLTDLHVYVIGNV